MTDRFTRVGAIVQQLRALSRDRSQPDSVREAAGDALKALTPDSLFDVADRVMAFALDPSNSEGARVRALNRLEALIT